MSGFLQIVIIALIVAFSVVQLFCTLFPTTARTWSGHLAAALRREASPSVLRHVGVWLTPRDVASEGCGSGGCNACKSCSTFTFDPATEATPPVRR